MKYKAKITILILSMFIITQFIGLYVMNHYAPIKVVNHVEQNTTSPQLPFGLEPLPETQQFNAGIILISLLPAFIIAISLFFILTKFKAEFILKAWFFIVITIALSISLISFLPSQTLIFIIILSLISAVLAFFKVYRHNFLIHNLTELFIYPGIAAIFVALLNSPANPNQGIYAIIVLLVLISLYDMWAVWHSKVMQKMAKYQINKLKIFGGFFIPYISNRLRLKLRKIKKSHIKNKKIKVNIALLGGGDIFYPILASGVVLRRFGFVTLLNLQIPLASILIIIGATIGLGYLLLFSERKKFYPAMPFISAGIFIALGICYLFL